MAALQIWNFTAQTGMEVLTMGEFGILFNPWLEYKTHLVLICFALVTGVPQQLF
ncbi:MAG: hypothetical protein ABJB86_07255 [Bacteroidota bacterium]